MGPLDVVRQAVDSFLAVNAELKQLKGDPLPLIDLYVEAILALAATVGNTHGDWTERQRRGLTWYDHRYDWLRGPDNWMPMERGILGMQHIHKGDKVLDLCCGDGFFAGNFFAARAMVVHGMDRNAEAIATAQRLYQREGVDFFLGDIVHMPFPLPRYNVVFWYDAIEHMLPEHGRRVLERIAEAIQPDDLDGLLFGSTPLGIHGSNIEHVNEFGSERELYNYLKPYFSAVDIQTSEWTPTRVQAYFRCYA